MPKTELSKIDAKGRLLVSVGFRELLGLKPESDCLVTLDDAHGTIVISPTTEKKLVLIKIIMSDAPGSLALMADVLSHEGVDLVSSESHSISRGKQAEWRVVCSAASVKDANSLKKRLLAKGAVSVEVKKL